MSDNLRRAKALHWRGCCSRGDYNTAGRKEANQSRDALLLPPDVVAQEHVAVAQVQPSVGDDGVRAGRPLAVVGLLEPPLLPVTVRGALPQRHLRRGFRAEAAPAL